MIQAAGRCKLLHACDASDHAEHDGAAKRKGKISGNNVQFADEIHGETSLVHVAARINGQTSNPFPTKKVSLADLLPPVHCTGRPATWLKTREINALKRR